MWNRISAEQTIRDTYPPDAKDPERARIGQELRDKAAMELLGRPLSLLTAEPKEWINLSNRVLYCLADLCLEREAADHALVRQYAATP